MIEVLFGESEAGAMKAAKSQVIASVCDGPTAVWMAGKKRPPERERGGWIEGTSEEVICLNFMLDMGDIREEADSPYRRNFIYSMYAQGQWAEEEAAEADDELRRAGAAYGRELKRLQAYMDDGESIRIWYSDAPYSLCGFYHLCSILQNYAKDVRAVRLPKYKLRPKSIVSYQNWNEVSAEEFAGFLPGEEKLSGEEIRLHAMEWQRLREDNSPLRAFVNGKLIGVPENFYDFLIWKCMPEKPVKEARLIGNILGRYPVSVGDWWYAKRIENLISAGSIRVVKDSKNKYAREICRC